MATGTLLDKAVQGDLKFIVLETEIAFGEQPMAAVAELEHGMISERTKAGMAVVNAQGRSHGRRHTIRDNPTRIAAARVLDNAGMLGKDGGTLVEARTLMKILNEADKKAKPITSLGTVRRWWRDGFPSLDDSI